MVGPPPFVGIGLKLILIKVKEIDHEEDRLTNGTSTPAGKEELFQKKNLHIATLLYLNKLGNIENIIHNVNIITSLRMTV